MCKRLTLCRVRSIWTELTDGIRELVSKITLGDILNAYRKQDAENGTSWERPPKGQQITGLSLHPEPTVSLDFLQLFYLERAGKTHKRWYIKRNLR